MRRRSSMLAGRRSPAAARLVARVAMLAVLLQAWLVVPLALRMAAEAASPLDVAEALCRAEPGGGRDGPGPAAPHHRHADCLLCHGGLGPLLTGSAHMSVAGAEVPPPSSAGRVVDRAPGPPAHVYASRAPPTSA